jgi:hypothetical protein
MALGAAGEQEQSPDSAYSQVHEDSPGAGEQDNE